MTVSKGLKSYKVVIIGDASVGKTSILGTLAYGVFDGNYNATIGVDYVPKIISLADSSTVKLNIWDTAGQEKFKSLIPTFLRDMVAGIIVFNISDRTSFENVRSWISFIKQEQGDEIVVSMTTDQMWTQNTIAKRCWEENIQWTMLPSEEFQTMKEGWFTQMKIVDSYDESEEKMSEFYAILSAFIDERRGGNDISQIEMGYVWKEDKDSGRYFWNVTSFRTYAKQKYNKAYETSLGEILAKLCEKEKNKYPDKKDSNKRFIQLHKTYQEYKGRCYSTLQTFKVIPRDNTEKIENFKKEMRTNEFTANQN
jgi:small GTP-binding protein